MSALVVGLGSRDRGDDAVGRLVLRALEGQEDLELLAWPGDPLALLGHPAWAAAERVVLVDAVEDRPGSVRVVDRASLADQPSQVSSHGLGVAGLLDLSAVLEPARRPPVVVAIGGRRFDVGAPMTPATRGAVNEAAALVAGLATEADHVPR